MKASRPRLTRSFKTASGPDTGSSTTLSTLAHRQYSNEMSSPAPVSLARQSPSNAPSSRNILASSSKLKTGNASSPKGRPVVSTSIRLTSCLTINQKGLDASLLLLLKCPQLLPADVYEVAVGAQQRPVRRTPGVIRVPLFHRARPRRPSHGGGEVRARRRRPGLLNLRPTSLLPLVSYGPFGHQLE